jgi:hypothetical protein
MRPEHVKLVRCKGEKKSVAVFREDVSRWPGVGDDERAALVKIGQRRYIVMVRRSR